MRDYAQRIIWNAKQVLDGPHELELVLDPRHWRIDNLVEKPLGWVPPSQTGFTRIRKPRAKLDLFVTSKGNLSVRWYPDIESWERNVPFDWIEAPATEPYAYQRPENELLFVRGVDKLHADPGNYMHREDGDNIAAINATLIALVWGMIEQIKKILSYSLEFEILTHFQVVTSRHSNDEEPFCQREEISGWRIISSHDLAIEQAMARIADFQRKTGFSVETALSALDDALKEPKKSRGDRHAFLAKYLRERGHKITAPVVRSLLEDLNSTYDPRYIRFRND